MMDFCKTLVLYVTAPLWFPVLWFLCEATETISEAPDGSNITEDENNG